MNTLKGINTRTNRTMQNNTFKKTQQKEQQHKKHHKIRTKFPKRIKKKQHTTQNQTLHLLFTSFNKEKPAMMNI